MTTIDENKSDHHSEHDKSLLTTTETLDVRGLSCPLPLLRTKQSLQRMQPGDRLTVLATDSGSWRDIPAFCEIAGHRVLERREVSGVYEFLLQKDGLEKAGE
jgi:tRNA 2-thiouridine synthesizing protein A